MRKRTGILLILIMTLCLIPGGLRVKAAAPEASETSAAETDVLLDAGMPPTITKQPQNVTAPLGNTAYFAVTATGSNLQYQWYWLYKTTNYYEWREATVPGNKTRILEVPATWGRNKIEYYCKVWNDFGTAYSDNGVLTVSLTPPSIVSQPASVTVNEGEDVDFNVTANGDRLKYQWQYRTSSSGSWQQCVDYGAATDGMTVKVVGYDMNGYQYRCRIKNDTSSAVFSNVVTLTVKPARPVITKQPAAATLTEGGTAKFSVTASGSALTYQWQYRTSSSGSWSNASAAGNKTATLSVPATLARNGYQYRCVVKNGGGTVNSKAVTLTVNAAKPAITTQPKDVLAIVGDTARFSVTASGSGLTYQWQYRTSSSGSWTKATAAGNTTAALSVPATLGRSGYQYRCVVKNSVGTAWSKAVTLTVEEAVAKPVITKQPVSTQANENSTAKFTVTVQGKYLTYQWQYRTSSSGSWSDASASGNKTATLSVPATYNRNGYQYRCVVKNISGTVNSNAATLTVIPAEPTLMSGPEDAQVYEGETAIFTVEADGNGLTYQRQYRKPGGSWNKATAPGNQTATLQVPATMSRNGYEYRCIVSNAGGQLITEPGLLTVLSGDLPVITVQTWLWQDPDDYNHYIAHVEAEGTDLTYQWQYQSYGDEWTDLLDGEDPDYEIYPDMDEIYDEETGESEYVCNNDHWKYRCKITGPSGASVYSEPSDVIMFDYGA